MTNYTSTDVRKLCYEYSVSTMSAPEIVKQGKIQIWLKMDGQWSEPLTYEEAIWYVKMMRVFV